MKIHFIPKVVRCNELPQWVIESDTACYHPFSNTIYIKNNKGIATLFHEYAHWFFHLIHFNVGHKILDYIWDRIKK